MNFQEIERAFLRLLYEAKLVGELGLVSNSICGENQWDKVEFNKAREALINKHLIKLGQVYEITAGGILHCEKYEIVEPQVCERNTTIRTRILSKLGKLYAEFGPESSSKIDELVEEYGKHTIEFNVYLLLGIGYLETPQPREYKLVRLGYENYEKHAHQISLINEFERLKDLSPHPRGRAFQKLLAKILERSGWSQEEGTKTSNEEMDIIISRNREYYLIECKWEKDPTQAAVIRELHGKLTNRVDVRGIVVSMSGFTTGAKQQAENYTSTKLILLFGLDDTNSLIYQKATFDELLSGKYNQLVTKREAIFS